MRLVPSSLKPSEKDHKTRCAWMGSTVVPPKSSFGGPTGVPEVGRDAMAAVAALREASVTSATLYTSSSTPARSAGSSLQAGTYKITHFIDPSGNRHGGSESQFTFTWKPATKEIKILDTKYKSDMQASVTLVQASSSTFAAKIQPVGQNYFATWHFNKLTNTPT